MTALTLTQSLQDYLEVMLNLSEKQEPVRITDIAEKLNVAKASVNQAINTLKDLDLVVQEKYGPVYLTEKGRKEATKVWYKHQMLYSFLVDVLGVKPAIAEKDACLMEHVVSSQTIERLVEFLNEYQGTKNNKEEIEKIQNLEKEIISENVSALSETPPG